MKHKQQTSSREKFSNFFEGRNNASPLNHYRNIMRFTLVELLVVIAVIAILASLLLPSLNKARDTARGIACGNNIRNFLLGANSYMDDYNEMIKITKTDWTDIYSTSTSFIGYLIYNNKFLYPFVDPKFLCPNVIARNNRFRFSAYTAAYTAYGSPSLMANYLRISFYGMVRGRDDDANPFELSQNVAGYYIHKRGLVRMPSQKALFAETNNYNESQNNEGAWLVRKTTANPSSMVRVDYTHSKRANVAFWDGHIARLGPDTLYAEADTNKIWQPYR